MSRPETRSPWYVRAWGWFLLVVAILDLLSYAVSLATDDSMKLRASDIVSRVVLAAGAIGLLS